MPNRPRTFFWLFTSALCAALLLPALVQDGMFQDGALYASVSKNLAEGYGTFWDPTFSETAITSFHEQPPLMFALEAVFFKIFGGIWPERIYSLLTAMLGIWLLARLWKASLPPHDEWKNLDWLPALIFFVMPVTFYAYTNNLEECTMTVFVLAGVLQIVRAMREENFSSLRLLQAGFWLLCAGLTKGVQGLFPLIAVGAWWLVFRDRSFVKMIAQSLLLALPLALFVLYAYIDKEVHASFDAYFGSRFTKTFGGVHNTHGRFHLLWELFIDIALPLALCGLAWLNYRFRKKQRNPQGRLMLFFVLLGFAGILPLMITLEQRGFYLVTALPYLAAALALLAAPALLPLAQKLGTRPALTRSLSLASALLLLAVLVFTGTQIGKTKRDEDLLHDIRVMGGIVGERKTIVIPNSTWNDWSLQNYTMRYTGISLDGEHALGKHEYFFAPKAYPAPENYVPVEAPLRKHTLYRRAQTPAR